MSVNVRIRNGMRPDPDTGLGGATEGDIRGSMSDLVADLTTGGVVDLSGGHLLVHQADTPDMTVVVDPGVGYVLNSAYDEFDSDTIKYWEVVVDAEEALVIASNSSGSTRIDLVCLYLDISIEPDEFASNVAELVIVQGTPGAGAPAVPDDHLKLAQIEVINGATTIPTAKITDSRTQVILKTSIMPSTVVNLAEGAVTNGKIVVSVASSDVTVALKTMSGNDPSASEPVYVRLGNATHAITEALNTTCNDGTNWFNAGGAELATKELDYFVYLALNAGTVYIGFARIPFGTVPADFSVTTTNEKYICIGLGISNYAATDPFTVIGRFAATLSAGAGYTWTVPTFTPANLIQKPIYETRWFTPAVPTFAGLDNGSGGQPTVTNNRVRIIGNKVERHIMGSGTKDSTDAGWNFTNTIFAPANTTDNSEIGAGGAYNSTTSSSVVMLVRWISPKFYLANNANITDNQVISSWGLSFFYEI